MSSNNKRNKPLIVFCHGSGDTGDGAKSWIQSLMFASAYKQFDWIFPTATPIPYTLNGGMVSSVWYDRVEGFEPTHPEQTLTIERSTDQLIGVIEDGIQNHGLKASQIVIGGFSMGGAIALQTAARWHVKHPTTPLGCVFGLSCYLNDDSKVWELLKDSRENWPKTFMAHGSEDDFILPRWGKSTWDRLQAAGIEGQFQYVPQTYHAMTEGELADVLNFVKENIVGVEKEECSSSS